MNEETWGSDYAEITADPDAMRAYAKECDEAAEVMDAGRQVFWAKTVIPDGSAWLSWRSFVDVATSAAERLGAGSVTMLSSQARALPEVYDDIWRATGKRLEAIQRYTEDLAVGIRQTADAVEDQDAENSDSIADSVDPEATAPWREEPRDDEPYHHS